MFDAGPPVDDRPPLLLAYVVAGCAALALVGAIIRSDTALVIGGLFGYVIAIVHGVAFVIRSRKRRMPAILLGGTRAVLGTVLAAMTLAAIANLTAVWLYTREVDDIAARETAGAALWAVMIGVLAWRAWIRPSARRIAWLQLIAVSFAVPAIFAATLRATDSREIDGVDVTDTTLIVMFIVIGCSGAVLDRLLWSVADHEPDVVPPAIVRQAG